MFLKLFHRIKYHVLATIVILFFIITMSNIEQKHINTKEISYSEYQYLRSTVELFPVLKTTAKSMLQDKVITRLEYNTLMKMRDDFKIKEEKDLIIRD